MYSNANKRREIQQVGKFREVCKKIPYIGDLLRRHPSALSHIMFPD